MSQTVFKPASTGRVAGPSPDDVRRRAEARVAEKIDLARSRHKPISIVRQEAKRVVEQFLDTEVPQWSPAERARFAESVVAESVGFGPLEEVFRDTESDEYMMLAFNQVIRRKADVWLPTSVQFRTDDHYRGTLAKLVAQGTPLVATPTPYGAIDVTLPNGFRMAAFFPPEAFGLPPTAVFARGAAPPAVPAPHVPPSTASGRQNMPAPRAAVPPPPAKSDSVNMNVSQNPNDNSSASGSILPYSTKAPGGTNAGTWSGSVSGSLATRVTDPVERLKIRVTERLVRKLAAAGVYDLSALPNADLHRLVAAVVTEVCVAEKFGFDEPTKEKLTLEILVAMPR